MNGELHKLAQLARFGFPVVPVGIYHAKLGLGNLHMNGEGLRFEPFKGGDALIISWKEFDSGERNLGS